MEDKIFTFRLEVQLIERLDRYAEYLEQKNPGLFVSRTSALRSLLVKGLSEVEAKKSFAPLLPSHKQTTGKKEKA